MKWTLTVMFLGLVAFSACKKESSMSKIPKITFNYLTDSITEGRDTILLNFNFEDGDADLQSTADDITVVKWKNSNAEPDTELYTLPAIPPSLKDPTKGIKGVATVYMTGALYTIDDSLQTSPDTFRYDVFIKDAKGNFSNTVRTSDLLVYPE